MFFSGLDPYLWTRVTGQLLAHGVCDNLVLLRCLAGALVRPGNRRGAHIWLVHSGRTLEGVSCAKCWVRPFRSSSLVTVSWRQYEDYFRFADEQVEWLDPEAHGWVTYGVAFLRASLPRMQFGSNCVWGDEEWGVRWGEKNPKPLKTQHFGVVSVKRIHI